MQSQGRVSTVCLGPFGALGICTHILQPLSDCGCFSFLSELNVADGILNCCYLKKQKQFYFAVGAALLSGLPCGNPMRTWGGTC